MADFNKLIAQLEQAEKNTEYQLIGIRAQLQLLKALEQAEQAEQAAMAQAESEPFEEER